MGGWMGGPLLQEIIPLRGSILQVGTCQIFSLAENPRWSRVWQKLDSKRKIERMKELITQAPTPLELHIDT